LNWNPVGEKGARALAEAPFRGLVRLDLRASRLGDAGLRALLGTHGFAELAILDLWEAGFNKKGERALVRWPRLPPLAYGGSTYYLGDAAALLLPLRQHPTFPEPE